MAVTEGHYNIVLKGKWNGGQDIINSFYFELHFDGGTLVGDDNEIFSIASHWWDYVKAALRALTPNVISYNQIDVFKADGSDVGNSGFFTIPVNERVGLVSDDALPPFVAYTFQYTRPNANFRHGYKRFAGVIEAWQANGIVNGTGITKVNDLAAVLDDDIRIADGMVNVPYIEPALVQRVKNGQPVGPDVWYKPSTVQFKKIGSQNSRKYNVGS